TVKDTKSNEENHVREELRHTSCPSWFKLFLLARNQIPGAENFMRAVVQRVSRAIVSVNGNIAGEICMGLRVLLGVGKPDTEADAASLAEKISGLRIFEDELGKMNRSVQEVGGSVL